MTRRIFRSILCVSAAVLLASLVITLGVLYGYINVQQKNELRDETMYLAPGVVERGAEYLLQLEDTGKRITLIDRDGTVLYDNEADSQEMENHLQREEVQEALASGEGTASRHSDSLSEPTMYYARLLDNGQILRLSGSEYRMMTVFANLLYPMCAVSLLMILLAAFFAMRASEKIVEPINRLDVEDVKEGDVYEEIAPLIQKIGHQKETITNQVLEAQRQQREFEDMKEQMRREFTANVSHELKTPLTSISGFAEIIKNGFVKPEDVPGFAGKIFEESQRLIVLVNDIIKISQLDEGGIPYDKEPLVQVFLQLITDRPGGGFWSYAELKEAGAKILGFPPFSDLRDLRNKLDCGLARELQQRDGLIVTHSAKGRGNVRGIRIEQYKVPDGYQTKIVDLSHAHARAYTKK